MLRTVDSPSCVLTVLKGEHQLINKQAKSKRYNPLDAGLEEANMQKPQKTESPALHFDIDLEMTLALMPTHRSIFGALGEQSDCKPPCSPIPHVRIIPVGLLTPGDKNQGSEKPASSLNLPHKEALASYIILSFQGGGRWDFSTFRFGEDIVERVEGTWITM